MFSNKPLRFENTNYITFRHNLLQGTFMCMTTKRGTLFQLLLAKQISCKTFLPLKNDVLLSAPNKVQIKSTEVLYFNRTKCRKLPGGESFCKALVHTHYCWPQDPCGHLASLSPLRVTLNILTSCLSGCYLLCTPGTPAPCCCAVSPCQRCTALAAPRSLCRVMPPLPSERLSEQRAPSLVVSVSPLACASAGRAPSAVLD